MPRRPDLPCTGCGKLIWRGGRSRPPGEARCRDCQKAALAHGSYAMYNKRCCRCDLCRAANARYMRAYAASYRARTGASLRDRFPDSPRRWISETRRLAVYERDKWSCHLCGDLVDRLADANSDYAPSLDHVIPRVRGGCDDDTNLRCAHRICNSARGARELVTS